MKRFWKNKEDKSSAPRSGRIFPSEKQGGQILSSQELGFFLRKNKED